MTYPEHGPYGPPADPFGAQSTPAPGAQYPAPPTPAGFPPSGPTQHWLTPPGSLPPAGATPARSRSPLPWILGGVGIVVVLALTVVGCVVAVPLLVARQNSSAGPGAAPATTRGGVPELNPTDGKSAQPTGIMYKVDVDYCAKLEFSQLGDWAVAKQAIAPTKGGNGTAGAYKIRCEATFKNGKIGHSSAVNVMAEVYASVADAQDGYKFNRDFDRSRFDKDLTGYGDQSYGTYRTWTPGWETSEYDVKLRSGNMFLSIHVSVSADAFIPKETMQPRVGAQAKSAFALVPKA